MLKHIFRNWRCNLWWLFLDKMYKQVQRCASLHLRNVNRQLHYINYIKWHGREAGKAVLSSFILNHIRLSFHYSEFRVFRSHSACIDVVSHHQSVFRPAFVDLLTMLLLFLLIILYYHQATFCGHKGHNLFYYTICGMTDERLLLWWSVWVVIF